jgi:hypothetical protein
LEVWVWFCVRRESFTNYIILCIFIQWLSSNYRSDNVQVFDHSSQVSNDFWEYFQLFFN